MYKILTENVIFKAKIYENKKNKFEKFRKYFQRTYVRTRTNFHKKTFSNNLPDGLLESVANNSLFLSQNFRIFRTFSKNIFTSKKTSQRCHWSQLEIFQFYFQKYFIFFSKDIFSRKRVYYFFYYTFIKYKM